MATRKILTSSIKLVITLLLVTITINANGVSPEEDQYCLKQCRDNQKMVAKDIIKLISRDIKDLRTFINTIPKLKSLPKNAGESPELLDCVDGLIGNITIARLTLERIRHLNHKTMPNVLSDSRHLKNEMNQAINLQGEVCHLALKDADRIVTSMLSRKLLDVAVIVDDVVYLVYQLLRLPKA